MILKKGQPSVWLLIAALACLVGGGALFALGYWQGQRSLQPQLKTITAEVTRLQHPPVNPWSSANAMRSPIPFMPGSNLPANATPEMKEFLQNRQTLMQKMTELRQQNPSATEASDPKLYAQFKQDNATLLQRQRELSQIIGQQQARNPLPEPPPLQISPNASPQLQAYLKERDLLMRDQIAFMNQHRTDNPTARQAAMQQWRLQNAARFQRLQQDSKALAQNPAPNRTTPVIQTSTPK